MKQYVDKDGQPMNIAPGAVVQMRDGRKFTVTDEGRKPENIIVGEFASGKTIVTDVSEIRAVISLPALDAV